MKTEQLIEKGVKKTFNGQEVLFNVESLKNHYDGVKIFESDILHVDGKEYVKVGDVNLDNATENDFVDEIEVVDPIEVIVDEKLISDNPELVGQVVVGETVTVDSIEDVDNFIKGENAKLGIISGTDENAAELAKVDAEIPAKPEVVKKTRKKAEKK